MNEKMEQTIFQIILHGGNGRSASMEAIAAAKRGTEPWRRKSFRKPQGN